MSHDSGPRLWISDNFFAADHTDLHGFEGEKPRNLIRGNPRGSVADEVAVAH